MEPPFGLEDAIQEDELAFGATVFQADRGNTRGPCIFTAATSHADRPTAMAYFKTQQGYRGKTGTLVFTEAATTITMSGILKSAMATRIVGVRWYIRYVFQITSVS